LIFSIDLSFKNEIFNKPCIKESRKGKEQEKKSEKKD